MSAELESEIIESQRNLVCVLFPGIVKNEEKAIQCLGGLKAISTIYCETSVKRLALQFNPDNRLMKPIYADVHKKGGVLLKVKVKKRKKDNQITREVISTSVVGRVEMTFTFESMGDFQYLPVDTSEGKPKCVLENLLPSGTDSYDFLFGPAPLHILPSCFTRYSNIVYGYTEKKNHSDKVTKEEENDDFHKVLRATRAAPLSRIGFSLTADMPTAPSEHYVKRKEARLKFSPTLEDEYKVVEELFNARPIWSLSRIRNQTKIRLVQLKLIMPCLALNMNDGPWGKMWIRFGYDPRKDPGARKYQTLDFRLRVESGITSLVSKDRRGQVARYNNPDRVRSAKKPFAKVALDEVPDGSVLFRPGMVPAQRQVFYQYCDIHLPEVQEIISAEPPPGYLCHEKRGWLPHGIGDLCREHIMRHIKEALQNRDEELNLEQGDSSDEDQKSDFDDADGASTSQMDVD